MTDYISLVKKIRSFVCKEYPKCEGCDMMGHECRSAIERQAADAIEELSHSVDLLGDANKTLMAAVPEWISVEERLPEKYHQVLVYGQNGLQIDYYAGAKSVCGNPLFMISEAKATHWMPLHEPPKEGKPK